MFYPVDHAARDPNLLTWVGQFDIPDHDANPPLFRRAARVRDFTTVSWEVWDGYKDVRTEVPIPLPEEIRNMPDSGVCNHPALVDAIGRDWSWAVALDEYDAEEASANAEAAAKTRPQPG